MVRSNQVFYIPNTSLYGIQEGTLVNSKIPTGPMARDWTTSIIRILQIIHLFPGNLAHNWQKNTL